VNHLVIFTLLCQQYPIVAHIMAHWIKVPFGPESGFKNKCRAGFGLQNEARLQLCYGYRIT